MLRFVTAVESAIREKNWYAALGLALTLPDMCAAMENPDAKGFEARYVGWYDRYLLSTYTAYVGPRAKKVVFLSGADCFALRCAFLHEGTGDMTPKPQRVLQRFHFVCPLESGHPGSHNNMLNGILLQLEVNTFCQDMCNGVRTWLKDVEGNDEIHDRMRDTLLIIHSQEHGISF